MLELCLHNYRKQGGTGGGGRGGRCKFPSNSVRATLSVRWINGTHVAVSPVNPYTNGFPTLVQVRYSPAGKLSVTYGGQPIFNDLTTPGFTLQPGDRYGFGARTGGATEVCTVDDVVIAPQ